MNIVKEFEDPEFMVHPKISVLSPETADQYQWFWGLSDDGHIFFRCTRFSCPDEWRELADAELVSSCLSLKTMKKLVKEFGHLLVYL